VHIARTGGSSIETALIGKDWFDVDPDTKHISAKSARSIYGENIWNTYKKFTVVRNPWDRLVSMWATKWWHHSSGIDENSSFIDFIKMIKPHPNELYNSLYYHEILNEEMDFILRFENLQNDFANMLDTIGIGRGEVQLPHVKKWEHQPYTAMYNKKAKKLVAKLFEEDIQKFNYSYL